MAFTTNLIAQSTLVKGNIASTKGENLVGASVTVRGTNIGTTTNNEGNFQLNVPKGNEVLVISYTGYLVKEASLNGNTSLNIALEEDA